MLLFEIDLSLGDLYLQPTPGSLPRLWLHGKNGSQRVAYLSAQALAAIYPQLARGAIASFDSRNVMRFLGHRFYENHEGEITSDYRSRPEGVCVKHRAMGNSIKVSVTRVWSFRIWRRSTRGKQPAWT